jgi:hypothetical protein
MKRIAAVAAIAIAAGLALSGCGITDSDDGADTHSTNSPSDMTRESKGTTKKGG